MLDRKEARKADTRLLERREIANVHKFVRRHCRRPCLHYCDTMVDGIYNCGRRRDEGKLWKHLLLVDGRKGKIDLSFACCLVYFLKKRYSCCRQPFNREALLARFRHMLLSQIHDC
ncbi:hypothetical protein T01_691 [Trichinella spiralis]|uniref:Uncharacterized protein n=1 Tax=Trichinella spiralis TaxID=6334 RepID=A0A0V1BMP6_TRISP|nr:hypothetical protein T01_691 [Trichinella spiralis]